MTRFFVSLLCRKEMKHVAQKLVKKGFFSPMIYLKSSSLLNILKSNIKPGDTIEIHAEGAPWVIGSQFTRENDYNPYSLAEYLKKHVGMQLEGVGLQIRACNSGTMARGPNGLSLCFARDLSFAFLALGVTVPVTGYKGYLQAENFFKESVVAMPAKHGAKVKHCRLEDAQVVYKKGVLEQNGRTTLVDDFDFTAEEMVSDSSLAMYLVDKARFEQRLTSEELDIDSITAKFNKLTFMHDAHSVADGEEAQLGTQVAEEQRVRGQIPKGA